MAPKVAIVICSTRVRRIGPKVANFIKSVTDSRSSPDGPEYVLVDVADFKLPVFDEVLLPAMIPEKGDFTTEHAKKWSAEMKQYAGYIFLTPEYNYGLPSSTKNAI